MYIVHTSGLHKYIQGLPSGFDIMYLALGDRNKRTLLIAFEALNKKVQVTKEIWN